ncbi:hypothetical protein OXPF_01060 [Oxobacter pfennigii]|uniref:Uncharacterized protein n=1 Tax=Oxobacter pfennigii TaxID=36849 RepID=A0A0P8WU77_9CLOT|nr:hypothetical protein [Oxobacter pfennigii]KPU46261.1 hypothetical protein OXPF_01060 [Oxobacter pfennigii]
MKKTFMRYIFSVILSMLLVTIGYFWLHGIPLIGLPEKEDVSYVEISDTNLTDEVRTFKAGEDIERAVNMANFLNYQLGTPKQEPPHITITYYLKNGKKISVSANKDTVFWGGKAYTIKGDNGTTFVKITEGLFFSDLLEANR